MNEDCRKNQEKYWEHRSHQLDARQQEELRAHLETCSNCQEQFHAFQAVEKELDRWEAVEPSAWFDQKLHARLEALIRPQKFLPWWKLALQPRWLMVCSTLLLCSLGGWFALRYQVPAPPELPVPVRGVEPVVGTLPPAPQISMGQHKKSDSKVHPSPERNEEISAEDMAILENLELLENYDLLQSLDFKKQDQPSGKTGEKI
jgi:hypothetical protein